MAGHSKWANIKHRKGAQDAKRAKIFAKLSKEITVAAVAGTDPNANSALRLAIAKARAQSMPKKNIEAALQKGGGSNNKDQFKELVYGANIHGVSFLIVCLTDNAKRTAAEVKHLVSKAGGAISAPSAVAYVFERKGILALPINDQPEETMMTLVLESGAADFEKDGGLYFVYTTPSNFINVKDFFEQKGLDDFKVAEVTYLPLQEVKLPVEKAQKIMRLIDNLEDNNDVQSVFHNLDAASIGE